VSEDDLRAPTAPLFTDAANRARIGELLTLERANFLACYHAVPAEARAMRPASGGWSAAEVVQHVARVEAGVAKMIAAGPTRPRASAAEAAAAELTPTKIGIVRDRSVKVQAPERVHPTESADAGAVVVELEQSRAALRAAFAQADTAVLDGVIFPHPFIGPLTLRAWVELVAHHDVRHAEQLQGLE
jgi:hypothetical protein